MSEKVTVLMTVYNGQEQIKKSIMSILKQTYTNFEFIIVNDGSTDQSAQIIRGFSEEDSRIVFIDRNVNRKRVMSLNEGLDACTTNYIFINDADDISHIDRLEIMMKYYNQVSLNANIGILGAASNSIDIVTKTKIFYPVFTGTFCKNGKIPMYRLCAGMPFIHSSFMYKKEALIKIGGFSNETTSLIDYFALIRIAQYYDVYTCSNCLVDRIVDGNNYFMKPEIMKQRKKNVQHIRNWMKNNIKYWYIYDKIHSLRLLKNRIRDANKK